MSIVQRREWTPQPALGLYFSLTHLTPRRDADVRYAHELLGEIEAARARMLAGGLWLKDTSQRYLKVLRITWIGRSPSFPGQEEAIMRNVILRNVFLSPSFYACLLLCAGRSHSRRRGLHARRSVLQA